MSPVVRCLAAAMLLAAGSAFAAPPGSDIWLVELSSDAEALSLSGLRKLTSRPGYDNQPAFKDDGELLFTSIDASGQADAWRIDPAAGTSAPLLQTAESEYSPTPTPRGEVSVVRVDADGVQQLAVLAAGAKDYEILFPLIEGVGYHAWIDRDRVALFLIRDSMELHVANRETGEVLVLSRDIGRGLQRLPQAEPALAFTEPAEDGRRWIKRYDFADRTITPLAPLPDGSQDFLLLPGGRLLAGAGRRLLQWRDEAWTTVATFDQLPGEISRLAANADATQLALVAAEQQ